MDAAVDTWDLVDDVLADQDIACPVPQVVCSTETSGFDPAKVEDATFVIPPETPPKMVNMMIVEFLYL